MYSFIRKQKQATRGGEEVERAEWEPERWLLNPAPLECWVAAAHLTRLGGVAGVPLECSSPLAGSGRNQVGGVEKAKPRCDLGVSHSFHSLRLRAIPHPSWEPARASVECLGCGPPHTLTPNRPPRMEWVGGRRAFLRRGRCAAPQGKRTVMYHLEARPWQFSVR